MAHFAELDEAGVVTNVVVVANVELIDNGTESEAKGLDFLERLYGHRRWVQTSYNANGNPAKRYRYAAAGYTYDAVRNAFITPQLFPSWSLNESTCDWVPPVPHPQDGKLYNWDEQSQAWVEAA